MLSFSTRMVSSMGVKVSRHSFTLSTASKIASLSSCMSLLYASGRPFIMVSRVWRSPYTLAVLPRISSVISGFFFWGMIDEPVANASSSSMNLNSHEHQRMISSEKRDRCIMMIERVFASSMQ